MIVGDLEQLCFLLVQQVEYISAVFIGISDDLAADTDQFTLDEFLQYDTRMCIDIGDETTELVSLVT